MATLGELLNIDYKQNSMTLEELQVALSTASSLPILSKQPSVLAAISSVTSALTAYTIAIKVYNTLYALMPSIKIATKAAAIPLNPAMATEVAQDVLLQAQSIIMEQANQLIVNVKNSVLNLEVSGT
jgi:hypothetical protein